jgi:hypothetical protein
VFNIGVGLRRDRIKRKEPGNEDEREAELEIVAKVESVNRT